jgi:hypothetical protein
MPSGWLDGLLAAITSIGRRTEPVDVLLDSVVAGMYGRRAPTM